MGIDELMPQDSDEQLAYDLRRESQEALEETWLEQLDPEALDGETLAPMRSGGRVPNWLRDEHADVQWLWSQLRDAAEEIAKEVADVQEKGDADNLLSLTPSNRNTVLGISTRDWRYVGLTRVGDRLELWFAGQGVLRSARGDLPGTGEIATLRVPLTSALLRKCVFDRVEWRERPPLVIT